MKLARSPLRRRITLALALAATAALSLALSASANVAPVEVKMSVTGRNTQYGYDPVVCNTIPTP